MSAVLPQRTRVCLCHHLGSTRWDDVAQRGMGLIHKGLKYDVTVLDIPENIALPRRAAWAPSARLRGVPYWYPRASSTANRSGTTRGRSASGG